MVIKKMINQLNTLGAPHSGPEDMCWTSVDIRLWTFVVDCSDIVWSWRVFGLGGAPKEIKDYLGKKGNRIKENYIK